MRVGTVIKPDQPGTKKLHAKHGERLVAVRYRCDENQQARHTTVELVENRADWQPGTVSTTPPNPDTVAIRVDWSETRLRAAKERKLMDRAIPVATQMLPAHN